MPDALWLPDAIRSMGVEAVEVDGWQHRGHGELYPEVFVSHHTADGPNGATPSLNLVINGAPYTAPGPLANILQSREPGEGNDKAYIIAAGTSYNAGTGGWRGVSGNNHTIGNEIEHTGTEPFPRHRMETACKIAAGCLLAMGRPADNHCHHWEWSYPPGSKIDVCCQGDGSKCSGGEWRELTADFMRGGGGSFTVGQMDDIAQWEWDTRDLILDALIGERAPGDQAVLARWENDTRAYIDRQIKESEERIIAAVNAAVGGR